MNMPIVRFKDYPPSLHRADSIWPCATCWPRIRMTDLRDELDTPCCAECASNPDRKLSMPWFTVRSLQ